MTATDLIESWINRLEAEQVRLSEKEQDAPVVASQGRLVQTVGGLHLYEFIVPATVQLSVDLPVSIVPADEADTTEGIVLRQTGNNILVQLVDALGAEVPSVTLIPDQVGLVSTSASRLKEMLAKPDLYHLGPTERLASLLQMPEVEVAAFPSASSVFSTVWSDDRSFRRQKLANLTMELIRANKRILLISPAHQECDEMVGIVGRTMKAGGLNHKTWITRYELPIAAQAGGVNLHELGFEAQMHQFYAKSQGDKASLKHKYDRFREIAPFLALKEAKQQDLDEVRLLEWRLVTRLRDLQVRMADVRKTLDEFDNLPLFQRLAMQAVGKNAESLKQYCVLYQDQMDELNKELDVAKASIQQLAPEAAVPRGMRAERDELKERIAKLGGTKKVRELIAAQENPNRQAFMQNRRVVAATPTRVASDPLFSRVRFDVLLIDEAPRIAARLLLAAAGLVRERIVISGDPRETAAAGQWAMPQKGVGAAAE
ncbi:MAG: AAA domain-containing protein [Nitrospira sp.]|nr:AAA domain-containing protein [Nitrospira sp.]